STAAKCGTNPTGRGRSSSRTPIRVIPTGFRRRVIRGAGSGSVGSTRRKRLRSRPLVSSRSARSAEMPRPPAVRIDDLADPRFPPEMEPVMAGLDAMAGQIQMDPSWLLQTAAEQTGLDDFGDDSFRARLDVFCTALRDE